MFEKLLLTVSLVLLGKFAFALKLDTLFGDTSYTLYDLRSDRWVDDSTYVIFRVRKSLKKDREKEGKN